MSGSCAGSRPRTARSASSRGRPYAAQPHLLAQTMVRREAVLSSRIEGTQATLSDLVRYEVAPAATPHATRRCRRGLNYVAAVEHVLDPDRRAAAEPVAAEGSPR
ncbi:Fic/DOC family N-terminal domain-containing protein, partial [Kutzneria kofuensis]|uniref:Fic/DOC family N-terminal domain-containing protein n=1 Tax=Kutzneria kofuensis TaxID=103725 RepID=UPI003CD092B8